MTAKINPNKKKTILRALRFFGLLLLLALGGVMATLYPAIWFAVVVANALVITLVSWNNEMRIG